MWELNHSLKTFILLSLQIFITEEPEYCETFSRSSSTAKSTRSIISFEISENFNGLLSPLKLAEVETKGLFNLVISFLQKSFFTKRIPMLPSSANNSFGKPFGFLFHCAYFGKNLKFKNNKETSVEITRTKKIIENCLKKSKGPFMFKNFSIADAMYAPVMFRFKIYNLKLSKLLEKYLKTLLNMKEIKLWLLEARKELK